MSGRAPSSRRVLFTVGKFLIGWYLGKSDVASRYGAAAIASITILLWIYYSSLILLFGAERAFSLKPTRKLAARRGPRSGRERG